MSTRVSESLVAGYREYAVAPDLTDIGEVAPASTPAILSFVAVSTVACGTAVSVISSGGVGTTIAVGC